MSKTTLYDVRADGKAHVMIAGRFAGADTGAPTYPIANPPGWTASRVSAGRYRLTFADQYAAFICATVTLEANTPADIDGFTAQTSTYTAGASPVLDIYVYDGAAAGARAVHDLSANEFVNFVCIFRNTTVAQ